MWALLDPHVDDGTNKPLVRGKTYRIPKALKKEDSSRVEPMLEGSLILPTILPCRLRGICFPEFAYLYNMETKRKNNLRKSLRNGYEEVSTSFVIDNYS